MLTIFGDIVPLLLNALIDAVVTVLIVDRLLAWREKRRWSSVRELFLTLSDRAIGEILGVWATWLELVVNEAPEMKLSDEGKLRLRDETRRTSAYVPTIQTFLNDLRSSSEPRMGYPFDSKAIDSSRRNVTALLAEKQFPMDHESWDVLTKNLSPSIRRLMKLVDRFSALVDPDLALPILRLSLEVDILKSRDHGIQNEWARIGWASRLASAIAWSLRLKGYVLVNRQAFNWEFVDSRDKP